MNFLLTLKHWQLFLAIIIFPVIFPWDIITHEIDLGSFAFAFLAVAWFYTITTHFHKKLPADVTMDLTRYKIFTIVPFVYIMMLFISTPTMSINSDSDAFIWVLPIHLFSVYCIFYCLYFTAKTIKSVELQRPVVFGDFAGEFFLLWFFPIGIWIIQPKINRLFMEDQIET